MNELFQIAALLACHTGVGVVARTAFETPFASKWLEKELGSQSPLSTAHEIKLRESLASVIQERASNTILWGVNNPFDLRQLKFFGSRETMHVLAENGVRKIFVDLNPRYQNKVDAVALGKSDTLGVGLVSKDQQGRETQLTQELIKNAKAEGISIIAADKGPSFLTKLYEANCLAMNMEAWLLSYISPSLSYGWRMAGLKMLAKHTLKKDRNAATFIDQHSYHDKSLVYFGNKQIASNIEGGLRDAFPGALVLETCDTRMNVIPMTPPESAGFALLSQLGLPARRPHFFVDFGVGLLKKCRD